MLKVFIFVPGKVVHTPLDHKCPYSVYNKDCLEANHAVPLKHELRMINIGGKIIFVFHAL